MDTTANEPLVRCLVIQNRLKNLNLVADKEAIKRILARIPKETLKTVQEAKKDQWLPGTLFSDINYCIAAEIGEEGVYNLSRKAFNKIIYSSIVTPLFRAALNIFKIQPKTFFKLVPLFWKSIYRNYGEVSIIERGPNQIQILFHDAPSIFAGKRVHLMGVAGAIEGLISVSGARPIVILENHSGETHQASFMLAWESNFSNLVSK